MNLSGEDRRTRRTRHALIEALVALLESRPYEQITVQDIVDRANVGRSTFYLHFQNKDDLLNTGFAQALEVLVQGITLVTSEDGARAVRFDTTGLYRHTQGHYALYRTLIWGSGFDLLTQDGHAALSEKIARRLEEILPDAAPSVPLPLLAHTVAGALLIMVKWWLDRRMPCPPEQMNAAFQQIVMPGIHLGLGLGQRHPDNLE